MRTRGPSRALLPWRRPATPRDRGRAVVRADAGRPLAPWLLVSLALLISNLPADLRAEPDYGPALPGFDPVLRTTRDPRLLGVDRIILRRQLLDQGIDPLHWTAGPDLYSIFRHQFLTSGNVDLEREVELLEVNGPLGLLTEFRYPEYFYLTQVPETLPGGFVYYPARPVTAPEVDLFVDEIRPALDRRWRVAQIETRRDRLDVVGGGRQSDRDAGLINLTIPIKLPRTLEMIIGRGDRTNIRISGRERISISGESSITNKFTPSERVQSQSLFPSLDMQQELQINLSGQVGEKIFIEVDHNSEVIGPDATKIRLFYRGNEDEIIQSIETGDVGLTLPNSSLLGYSSSETGLFGLKVTGKVGPADFTVVASKQKAESSAKSFNAQGGETTERVIESWNYLDNRFFRLDLPVLTPSLGGGPLYPQLPAVDSPGRRTNPIDLNDPANEFIDPNSIKVFIFVGSGQPQPGDVQNIAVYRDITGRWDADGQTLPDVDSTEWTRGERWTELRDIRFLEDTSGRVVALDLGREYTNNDLLAVTYRVVGDLDDPSATQIYEVGDPPGAEENRVVFPDEVAYLRMKLLKPNPSIGRDAHTFHYVLRNIYSLGGSRIDPQSFDLRIEMTVPDDHPERDLADAGAFDFVRHFGLDIQDQQGNPGADGIIDKGRPEIFDLNAGLLKFPLDFPFPFAAADSTVYIDNVAAGDPTAILDFEESYLKNNRTPGIYDHTTNPNIYNQFGKFRLVSTNAATASSFNLGQSDIEEGSETVTVDGRVLQRDVDYDIDYAFGQITLKGDAANLTPDSQVSVTYQYAPFIGGGNSSLVGFNLGYDLSREGKLSTTWLYQSEQIVGEKAKLGEEPNKMLVGVANLQQTLKPGLLTGIANLLSRVDTDKESSLVINGEIAMSMPDPNTKDEVFLEDFEGIDSSDIVNLSRQGWSWASAPDEVVYTPERRLDTVRWYLPKDRVLRRYLNPTLREQERTESQPALELYLRADQDAWEERDWGGIMRGLSSAGLDLTRSQFVEFWINDGQPLRDDRRGILHIDFGFISEDFFWPDDGQGGLELRTFQKEDINGDGIFTSEEDIGLDGIPDTDVFSAEFDEGTATFPGINFTEKNNREDSEDLNGNTILDEADGYFGVTIDLKDTDPLVDVVYDYDDVQDLIDGNISWRKYRVPIADLIEQATDLDPDLAAVTHIRIWYEDPATGRPNTVRLQLSELKFLGSRWEREGIRKSNTEELLAQGERGPGESFFLGEVNNKENPDYFPPFAVREENRIPEKEQSLVIDFQNLEPDHMARISKVVSPRGDDYTRYERLSWYWYNADHNLADVDIFYRVGSDTLNFYELRYRFAETSAKTGWRRVQLDLAELANVKNDSTDTAGFSRIADIETGQEYRIRVVGRPDLRNVKRYYFGVSNEELSDPVSGFFWFNDIMLQAVKRDRGFAESAGVRLNMADVLKVDFDWERRDAEYHGLDRDRGQGFLNERWSLSTRFRVDDFVPLLGFQMPVNLNRRQAVQRPKYEPNSDIEILDEEVRNALSTIDETEGFSAQFRHSPTQFFLTRYLIDPWVLTLSGSRASKAGPLVRDSSKSLQGSASYDLRIPGRNDFSSWPILGLLPLVKSVSLLPSKISFGASFNSNEKFSSTIDRDGTVTERPTVRTSTMNLNGSVDYSPLEIVTLNYQGRSDRDRLREQFVGGVNIGQENQFSQSFRLTFTVPKPAALGTSAMLSLPRLAIRGINQLRPSISFDGDFTDNHGPNVRQPGDPENVRNISNSGAWEFRGRVPLGDLFSNLFPERKRSAAEEQRLIEQQRRLQRRSRPGDESEQIAPDEDLANLTPEQRLERERQRLLEEAEQRQEDEGQDQEEVDDGGPSFPNPLSPVLAILRGLNPITVNYSDRDNSSFGRLDGKAPLWYTTGLVHDLGETPDSLFVSSSLNENQTLTVSTTAKLGRALSLDVKYGQNRSRSQSPGRLSGSYSQDWPDLRLAVTSIEKLGIFGADEDGRNGWFKTSSVDVAYKFTRSASNFTESTYNPKSTTTITPRWNVTFQSDLNASVNVNLSTDVSQNNGISTEADRLRVGLQIRHNVRAERLLAQLGLYRPGSQPTINMDVDLSYSTNRSRRIVPNSMAPPTETGQNRISLTPRFSYQVTRNLSGALNLSFSRTQQIETDLTTTTLGLGLEATFVF